MVPKIHAKGTSFVGLGQYVLHDKDGAQTSDRVEFVQSRNLATDDPELAVRLMAATAMDSERLKANAGVKKTGRKSDKAVLHVTLAWHPKQSEELTPEEMLRAADLAIRALGAEDRQALIVSHSDEEQKHLHLVINRVSPQDGRMLSSSKEKLKLSRFAQKYEEQWGEILCEQRVINNKARDRGEYTRGEKDTPRHIYEQHNANDNRPGKAERHRQQREKDKAVGKEQRVIRDKQAAAWTKLQQEHKARRASILQQQKTETASAKQAIRDEYRANQWTQLHHEHQAETRAFARDEQSFLGRMKNRARAIDLKGLVGSDDRKKAISDAFSAIASSGARLEWLKKDQVKREAALKSEQKGKEEAAAREVRERTKVRLQATRTAFEGERSSLTLKCAGESAKMRAQWQERLQQRAIALDHEVPKTQKSLQRADQLPSGKQSSAEDTHLTDIIRDFQRIQEQLDQERDHDRDTENER